MALQTSGAISLNQIHIAAGGSSGTTASLNDSDIRGLIGKSSGATSSFSEFYGASAEANLYTGGYTGETYNSKNKYMQFYTLPFFGNYSGTGSGYNTSALSGGYSSTPNLGTFQSSDYATIFPSSSDGMFTYSSLTTGFATPNTSAYLSTANVAFVSLYLENLTSSDYIVRIDVGRYNSGTIFGIGNPPTFNAANKTIIVRYQQYHSGLGGWKTIVTWDSRYHYSAPYNSGSSYGYHVYRFITNLGSPPQLSQSTYAYGTSSNYHLHRAHIQMF